MKKLLFILIVIVCVSGYCSAADDYGELLDSYTENYSSVIEESIKKSGEINESDFPDFDAETIMKNASSGKTLFSFKSILNSILEIFIKELKLVSKSMIYILAVSLLGSFLLNLNTSMGKSDITTAGYLCIYILIIGVLATVFSELSMIVLESVKNLSLFVKGIFPVIIASLYSSGCIASSTVLQPVLVASTQVCVHLIEKFLVPVVMISFSVCSVSCLSDKINADKFAFFLIKTVKWILAAMLIVFIGVVGLQSVASSTVDGLSVKLTKFATSNIIPVVGGLLSESVETLMNCSIVIKNSVGICGILAVIYISFMPLLKLWVNLIILRFSAAVMQPVSDERIIKCITNTADLVSLLLAILASLSVMFILIITIIINTGNSAIMLGR